MLNDVEQGTDIFIDANIFLYDILEHWKYGEVCKTFLEAVNRGKITSVLVCNEIFHRAMIAEVVEKYKVEPKSVVSYLKKKNWGIIKGLNKAWSAVEIIKRIENLRIVEIDREIFDTALGCSKKYCLLSNDSFHVATMKKYRVTNIATNDSDFERVEWLKVWKPQ
jgi:predicted nucleic acid-binding protein